MPDVVVCRLPNGCTLYRETNGVGGHRYWSDEVPGGAVIWDTSAVDAGTLLVAISEEMKLEAEEIQRRMDALRYGHSIWFTGGRIDKKEKGFGT